MRWSHVAYAASGAHYLSEKLFFYSDGPRVYGVLLSRSDRVKWFGPKRPAKPTKTTNQRFQPVHGFALNGLFFYFHVREIHGQTNVRFGPV